MQTAPINPDDPRGVTALVSLVFLGFCLVRLNIPSTPYFDEVHYLPAAREMFGEWMWKNREHPMLGKQLLALGMAIFGDNAWGWRIMPVLFGTLAVFAGTRAMWHARGSAFASIAFGILLATGFHLFVHARIAMLDIFMVAFFAVALWQCAAAIHQPETGRWRLAIAGIALGLAMGSKWNVLLLAALPGIGFFAGRLMAGRRRLFTSRRGSPVPGISLLEAALLLGALPLFVYWLTFWPAYLAPFQPLEPGGFVAYHREVLDLQASVTQPHPYQSNWPQWVANWRAIWYLYEPIDGAQRGIMLIGNPATMLLGLPALAWAAWSGIMHRRWDALALVVMYLVSVGMWAVVNKPIQFYYHYLLPSCFLLGALALLLDDLRNLGGFWRWLAWGTLALSAGMFAWFYPILSAAELEGPRSFAFWMWTDSWR
ncbi:glycosyltransferase family 39 protein [Qipengyuania sp. JC766]|uniref:phospholipid carrier-dependent glycosyltransferase n=1 Tax=Qipengyuania sp. JC766 TaxID=3232139 RepID=UPI003457975A